MTKPQRATREAAAAAVHDVHDLDLTTWINQLIDDQRSLRYIANTISELTGGPTPSVQTVANWAKS